MKTPRFQFYISAIITNRSDWFVRSYYEVSILHKCDYNEITTELWYRNTAFQFYISAIITVLGEQGGKAYSKFQFYISAIITQICPPSAHPDWEVSILHKCDYNKSARVLSLRTKEVSILHKCDYNPSSKCSVTSAASVSILHKCDYNICWCRCCCSQVILFQFYISAIITLCPL